MSVKMPDWDTALPNRYENEVLADLLADYGYDPDNPPEWVTEESDYDQEQDT